MVYRYIASRVPRMKRLGRHVSTEESALSWSLITPCVIQDAGNNHNNNNNNNNNKGWRDTPVVSVLD